MGTSAYACVEASLVVQPDLPILSKRAYVS
jgi:hypothetical protein